MVFHLCDLILVWAVVIITTSISAHEEFDDEEQLPTGSTDEDNLF